MNVCALETERTSEMLNIYSCVVSSCHKIPGTKGSHWLADKSGNVLCTSKTKHYKYAYLFLRSTTRC